MSRWKHQSACSADHFAKRPQAQDDSATGGEDAAFSIDVLANDRGGRARSLYSVDQNNPSHALTSTTLASGATVSIVDGQILYDPGSAFQFLDAGETATDTFSYAIRLGKGTISTATVTVTIEGADDQTGLSVERVSVSSAGEQGNDLSFEPSISADGRFVAYRSFASNLVEGDTNNTTDIFVAATQGFLLV
jgi:VCBS repeat-containing protein